MCTHTSHVCVRHISMCTHISHVCVKHISMCTHISHVCVEHMSMYTHITYVCKTHALLHFDSHFLSLHFFPYFTRTRSPLTRVLSWPSLMQPFNRYFFRILPCPLDYACRPTVANESILLENGNLISNLPGTKDVNNKCVLRSIRLCMLFVLLPWTFSADALKNYLTLEFKLYILRIYEIFKSI